MTNNDKISSRIVEFEALRALAIVLLLPLHSGLFDFHVFGIYLGPFAAYVGAFLLGSFFFLAGYFTTLSFHKPGGTFFSFLWSKIIRIFPPYWFALILFVSVLEFSLRRRDLLIYFLNLQFLFSPAFAKQILTLWYVSLVFAYFVIFGFLLSRRVSFLVLLACTVILFGAAYFIHINTGLFDGRFFEYLFIFLAGLFFSRFPVIRERIYSLHLIFKLIFAVIGAGLFWYVQKSQYYFTSWQYLLSVDIYILGSILFWLGIFRSGIGKWKVWSFLSYASFFAYLLHRPIWQIFGSRFVFDSWENSVLFIVFAGSLVVFVVSYFLQYLYDSLLSFLCRWVNPVSKI